MLSVTLLLLGTGAAAPARPPTRVEVSCLGTKTQWIVDDAYVRLAAGDSIGWRNVDHFLLLWMHSAVLAWFPCCAAYRLTVVALRLHS